MTNEKQELLESLNNRIAEIRAEIFSNNRVLVVDDEEVVCELMRPLLEGEGYVVETAESVGAARALLEYGTYSLALLDKNLPDGTGIDLLKDIRRIKDPPEAVIITGYASYDSVVEAMRLGALGYLTKPFGSLDEIRAKVKSAIQRKRRKQMNEAFTEELKKLIVGVITKRDSDPVSQDFFRCLNDDLESKLADYSDRFLSKTKILVVESDGASGVRLPSFDSLRIDFTTKGAEALELLRSGQHYNLLITETNIADRDWTEIVREARRLHLDIAVIVQTGKQSMELAIEALNQRANEYIIKPVESYDLYAQTINNCIKASKANMHYSKLVEELRRLLIKLIEDAPGAFDALQQMLN